MAAICQLQVRITKYLMCICGEHMCICTQNIKFLCLTPCQGGVCTDDNADADTNNDANDMDNA